MIELKINFIEMKLIILFQLEKEVTSITILKKFNEYEKDLGSVE